MVTPAPPANVAVAVTTPFELIPNETLFEFEKLIVPFETGVALFVVTAAIVVVPSVPMLFIIPPAQMRPCEVAELYHMRPLVVHVCPT